MHVKHYSIPAGAAALAALLAASAAAAVDLRQRIDFSISAGTLSAALVEFSKQAHVQVLAPGEGAAAASTGGVSGEKTMESALNELLKSSGFEFEVMSESAIAVRRKSERQRSSGVASEVDAMHVAQAEESASGKSAGKEGQQNGGNGIAMEEISEIVVTAQKRAERLQDVPISISVLRGDDLDSSRFEGTTEALRSVPGVAATVAVQGGATQLAVRGVSASNPVLAGGSPIAYYLDSAPFGLVKSAILPDANVYDLDRIEVLRGPQGTLYGASAQNGVVRVITKDPSLTGFEFKARGSASTTDNGAPSSRIDAAMNIPLVSDKLAARVVFGYENLGGWIDKPNEKDANDAKLLNARVKFNAQPTEEWSLGLMAWVSRSDYGSQPYAPNNSTTPFTLPDPISTDFDVFAAKIGYEFPGVSVSAVTSHLDYKNDQLSELLGLNAVTQNRFDSKIFTQEINLNSTHEGSWRWSGGGIYRNGEDRLFQTIIPFIFLAAPIDFSDKSRSFAFFGEVTRLFLDRRFELTGGLRYFEDEVEQSENIRNTGIAGQPLYRASSKLDKLSPRAVLTWHPSTNSTVYTSYSEGFRSGSNQTALVANTAPNFPPVRPDNLKNYEVGAKTSLLDGRLSFDMATYFIDWRGVQQTLLVPVGALFATGVVNGASASGVGFEAGATARLLDGLTLGASFSWNDLAFDRDVLAFPAAVPQGVVVFEKGARLNLSPESTIGGSAIYQFALGEGGYEGRLSVSANYMSKMTNRRLRGVAVESTSGDSLLFGRASFGVQSSGHWTASLFVDNVTNEGGAFINNWLGNPNSDTRARPRTFGIQVELKM